MEPSHDSHSPMFIDIVPRNTYNIVGGYVAKSVHFILFFFFCATHYSMVEFLIWHSTHLSGAEMPKNTNTPEMKRKKNEVYDGDGIIVKCWCFEFIYDMLSNSRLKWVGVNDTPKP